MAEPLRPGRGGQSCRPVPVPAQKESVQEWVRKVHLDHPREESTFWFICLWPTRHLRSYKATKVVFLKREESARYSLEEAEVTG